MADEFFEWLFEEHYFAFKIIVVVLLTVVASGILELIKMWWFS